MWKLIRKTLAPRNLGRGLLAGVAGGLFSAIGWKLGSDAYDAVKRGLRRKEQAEEIPAEREEPFS